MTAKKMTETIVKKHGEMEAEMMAYVEKGSNAAARRARSASLELAKLYKEYRRITLGSNAAARRARSASLELAKLYKEYRRITLEEAKNKKS